MKLILDEHIPTLVKEALETKKNKIIHVTEIKSGMSDQEIFNYANKNNYCIVTNDHHFDRFKSKKNSGIIIIKDSLRKYGIEQLELILNSYNKGKKLDNMHIKISNLWYNIEYNKYHQKKNKKERVFFK